MDRRFFKATGKCKICRKKLPDESMHISFCEVCAIKEITKLKKRIWISALIGVAVALIVFAALYYMRSTAFVSDMRGYENDIFIPTFFGYFAINFRAFNTITNLSVSAKILLALVCFLAPSGSYVYLAPDTYRHKAERSLYRQDPLVGGMMAGYENHRLEGVGFFILELTLSAISGPFYFFYRPYKLRQLTNYVKAQTTQ